MNAESKKNLLLEELGRIAAFKFLPDKFDNLDVCMFGGGNRPFCISGTAVVL
mgnify:FL=1